MFDIYYFEVRNHTSTSVYVTRLAVCLRVAHFRLRSLYTRTASKFQLNYDTPLQYCSEKQIQVAMAYF